MKNKYTLIFILWISFYTHLGFAAQPAEQGPLSQKIEQILKEFGENVNIGIFVQEAKTGKVLYQKDIDRYFMPASSQKLFTAYAALQALGADFTYSTQLFFDYTKIRKGDLKDNLYLQFSGDPTLTAPQFEQLINALAQAEIRRIKGDIIIDDSIFDQMAMSPGTAWEDQNFCWGSPINSLTINHNCVKVTLMPAEQPGQLAKLELPDYPQSMQFINQVITSPAAENCTLKVQRSDAKTYTLSGCIHSSSRPRVIEMAINDPRENLQKLLNYSLKKNHITTTGKVVFKPFVTANKPFARQDSQPLKVLVAKMLKDSDNTIADALFKTMGANYAHEAGSFTNGNKAVRELIAKSMELHLPKTTLIDGAGASRYNFLTPQQIVALLQKIFVSPGAKDFIASLPVSGIDGTLKDRLKGPLTVGKIHAKTGSETAVTSLSGYLETRKKQTLIFAIMINGFTNPASKYKALEDKICRVLAEGN